MASSRGRSDHRAGRKAARELKNLNIQGDEASGDEGNASTMTGSAYPQVAIDSNTLPVGLSVFCNRNLFSRELIFSLKRLDTLETIKTVISTHFAYEFKRMGLPSNVYFAGLNCLYHRSADSKDVASFGTFITEVEYQLTRAEIMDGETKTGQLLRLQVVLYTDEQLAKDKDDLKDWFTTGERDAMRDINGLKWMLEFPNTNNPYENSRFFETVRDNTPPVTIPAHIYRENVEKAIRGDGYRENYTKLIAAKGAIRNEEYKIRKELIEEVQGLRLMLRKAGVTVIETEDVKAAAREAQETERGGKVAYPGQTQDFKRVRELRKQVEDKSDEFNTSAMAFEKSWRNV